jgi:hypothetical protein
MPSQIYAEIKAALKHLNPAEIRKMADRRLSVGLIAATSSGCAAVEDLLAPPVASEARRCQLELLHPGSGNFDVSRFDIVLCESELLCPPDTFPFDATSPQDTVKAVIERREDLRLALARNFRAFRRPVIEKIVRATARENAAFCILTALPDVLPSLIELPWLFGEFASDTAFVTANQVRMTFLIAGASAQDIGYREQRAQIAAIVAGAFGWRALARELTGKIPFGGGLIPKAAIAFAGTYTMGTGLEHFYRLGYGLTKAERRQIYGQAIEKGRALVSSLIDAARPHTRAAVAK